MLHWEDDVLPMVNATRNARDAALIAVAWDSGARSGELRDLSVGNVTDHKHGLQVTVDGKTGQRTVTLIPSVPYLQRWLSDHPTGDDAQAPLWSDLNTSEEPSYQQLRKSLREAAERARVTKPVTFTNYRKSSAAHLASSGVNQAHIEQHHGWSHGSSVAAHYITVFVDATTFSGTFLGINTMLWIVSAGFTISLTPFLVFIAYALRLATLAKQTLTVGPLVLS